MPKRSRSRRPSAERFSRKRAAPTSWGVLINDGQQKMEEFPWLLLFPGAAFSLTLFSLNFLGDGLRDALDVRSSKD